LGEVGGLVLGSVHGERVCLRWLLLLGWNKWLRGHNERLSRLVLGHLELLRIVGHRHATLSWHKGRVCAWVEWHLLASVRQGHRLAHLIHGILRGRVLLARHRHVGHVRGHRHTACMGHGHLRGSTIVHVVVGGLACVALGDILALLLILVVVVVVHLVVHARLETLVALVPWLVLLWSGHWHLVLCLWSRGKGRGRHRGLTHLGRDESGGNTSGWDEAIGGRTEGWHERRNLRVHRRDVFASLFASAKEQKKGVRDCWEIESLSDKFEARLLVPSAALHLSWELADT